LGCGELTHQEQHPLSRHLTASINVENVPANESTPTCFHRLLCLAYVIGMPGVAQPDWVDLEVRRLPVAGLTGSRFQNKDGVLT
jgi:hypothetical protein